MQCAVDYRAQYWGNVMSTIVTSEATSQGSLSRQLLDALIRAGLIAVLAAFCYRVCAPFINLMMWALILAVTLYPLHARVQLRFPERRGTIAALIILIVFAAILGPMALLGFAFNDSIQHAMEALRGGGIHIPPPDESVSRWPAVGPRVYGFWQEASTDVNGLMQKFAPNLKQAGLALLGLLTGFGKDVLIFFGAIVIAGVIMAHGERGHASALQIASRISGPAVGLQITDLCTATVRAVALGVVGVAFIQMILISIGFVVMGVPASGLLAVAILLIGIMQLPATLITVPVIVFMMVTRGFGTATIVFSIYVFVAGLVDNLIKPFLLGRGVAVPMPVVLFGALGGMVSAGVIGLFMGPVILAVGYQIFWRWVRDQPMIDRLVANVDAKESRSAQTGAERIP